MLKLDTRLKTESQKIETKDSTISRVNRDEYNPQHMVPEVYIGRVKFVCSWDLKCD